MYRPEIFFILSHNIPGAVFTLKHSEEQSTVTQNNLEHNSTNTLDLDGTDDEVLLAIASAINTAMSDAVVAETIESDEVIHASVVSEESGKSRLHGMVKRALPFRQSIPFPLPFGPGCEAAVEDIRRAGEGRVDEHAIGQFFPAVFGQCGVEVAQAVDPTGVVAIV